MAGTILSDETELYVFMTTGAAPAKAGTEYTFDELVGTGMVGLPANEVVADVPPEFAGTAGETSSTPVGRTQAISKPGSFSFSEVSFPLFLARAEGRAVTAAQATAARAIMDLARGTGFNIVLLMQAPTDTAANNITRSSAGALTIPASIENATAVYVRATKGFSPPLTAGAGGFNRYTLNLTPSELSGHIDHS